MSAHWFILTIMIAYWYEFEDSGCRFQSVEVRQCLRSLSIYAHFNQPGFRLRRCAHMINSNWVIIITHISSNFHAVNSAQWENKNGREPRRICRRLHGDAFPRRAAVWRLPHRHTAIFGWVSVLTRAFQSKCALTIGRRRKYLGFSGA